MEGRKLPIMAGRQGDRGKGKEARLLTFLSVGAANKLLNRMGHVADSFWIRIHPEDISRMVLVRWGFSKKASVFYAYNVHSS